MAAIGNLKLPSHVQKPVIWTGNDADKKRSPAELRRKTKNIKSHAGKRTVPTCTIQIDRRSLQTDQLRMPGSPSFRRLSPTAPQETSRTGKGWTNAKGFREQRFTSKLNALAVQASDRAEMHAILAKQRDNWNLLFHTTVTVGSVATAAATAMNAVADLQGPGLSMVSSILGLGVGATMGLMNYFQPSQLADEQKHAARFFKRLETEIEGELETDPNLCKEASHSWEEKVTTFHALDQAFPLPLTPIVVEKFPSVFLPSIISGPPADRNTPPLISSPSSRSSGTNGWTFEIEKQLQRASQLLHTTDIPAYLDMAESVNNINKFLAMLSPVLAFSGALCNCGLEGMQLSELGAAFTVAASFVHSLSHAVQLGAAYDTYRNCAGYYTDVERSIETTIRLPVQEREDGLLFLQKISLQLGRSPQQYPLIPADQTNAGTLF